MGTRKPFEEKSMIHDWGNRFSENIKDFTGYDIGKMLDFLVDPEIISLAGGLPSPHVFLTDGVRRTSRKILDDNIERILQYSPVKGEGNLIDAVIEYLRRDDIHVTRENVLITSSGQNALDITGRLFLNPGDPVILDRPTFAGAIVAFRMQRPKFTGIDLQDDGSDIEGFRGHVENMISKQEHPKFIYVVPDFQNPTGITMSLEKRHALLDLSHETQIPIIEDSPYRNLRYHGKTIPSIFSLDQERGGENVIGLYTFSKLFCPGMRIGFTIGPRVVIEKMTNIKEGNILNTPKYNQEICTSFLTEMGLDAHIQKSKSYYQEKLQVFLSMMEKHFPPEMGVTWTKPEGGLFLWVTVPDFIDTTDLFYEAIKYKVAFVPGESFFAENPSVNHMRINFSYPSKEQLAEAVKRLSGCIRDQIEKRDR